MSNLNKVLDKADAYVQLSREFNEFKGRIATAQEMVNNHANVINNCIQSRVNKLYTQIDRQIQRVRLELDEWKGEFGLENKVDMNKLEKELASIKRKAQGSNLLNQHTYDIDSEMNLLREKMRDAQKVMKPFKRLNFEYEITPLINEINFGSLIIDKEKCQTFIRRSQIIMQKSLGNIESDSNTKKSTLYVKRPIFTSSHILVLRFELSKETSRWMELLEYDYDGNLVNKKNFKCAGKIYACILTTKNVFSITEIKEKSDLGEKKYEYLLSVYDHDLKLLNYNYLASTKDSFNYDFVHFDSQNVYVHGVSQEKVLVYDTSLSLKTQISVDQAQSSELFFTDNSLFIYKENKLRVISRDDHQLCRETHLKHNQRGPITFTDNFIYFFETKVLDNILLKLDLSGNIVDKYRLELNQDSQFYTSMCLNDKHGLLVTLWSRDEIVIAKL